ncbi:hypothetical protein PARPLA_01809 [Rhodobacteraceae bacterium THAF1]|uniref:DUF302 domain-containing protein n=1 Tax=Palleronia sp. THAF1 TaxID=2587842 RepID=UPI000F3D649B|nr:DUF302 domain-containing protein [Palleronia sp. THAF1]QFU09056.1 hypothetical protein FIU81_10260 [Palleronia sp. THAF1]VDC24147.1 hypothetical protein PARPLA_01809 [Rhodobacteraceae bacterium THAF1]
MRLAALALACLPSLATAQDVVSYDYPGSFEDAAFGVESAIVNRGLVLDFVSHVGEMLNRTQEDVGGEQLYTEADIFVFCSAVVSREVMEANPDNIAFCPYGVFVAERDGQVRVGYRTYPDGPMDQVETLLDGIAREAAGQ